MLNRKNRAKWISYTLCGTGGGVLILSFLTGSAVAAFVGLGLTLWGVLLLTLAATRYVKSELLDFTTISALQSIEGVLKSLDYHGKGIYFPVRVLGELGKVVVFIPAAKEQPTSLMKDVIVREQVFTKDPKGVCMVPPGFDLASLYERELRTEFAGTTLESTLNLLPKLFVEDLELADEFEVDMDGDTVHVRMVGSVYHDLCSEVSKLSHVHEALGCPLCSSIGCVLVKATGRPMLIEESKVFSRNKTVEAKYRFLKD